MDQIIDFKKLDEKVQQLEKYQKCDWNKFIKKDLNKCKSIILEKILINHMLNNNYWDDNCPDILESLIKEIRKISDQLYNLSDICLAYIKFQAYDQNESSYLDIKWKDIPFRRFNHVSSFVAHQALLDLIMVMYQIFPLPPHVLLNIIDLTEIPILKHSNQKINLITMVKKSIDKLYLEKGVDINDRQIIFKTATLSKNYKWELEWRMEKLTKAGVSLPEQEIDTYLKVQKIFTRIWDQERENKKRKIDN